MELRVVAVAGNPNVGKSTLFNNLTGMNQHTGNWPGKTVGSAQGYCKSEKYTYRLVDIPGTYSLIAHSPEEEVARDYICSGEADAVLVVCDATCLERNLNLALQIINLCQRVVVCVNLLDEAEKKGICINLEKLSKELGVPVVGTVAWEKENLDGLLKKLDVCVEMPCRENQEEANTELSTEEQAAFFVKQAEEIAKKTVSFEQEEYYKRDRKLDRLLTSKRTGYPVMILLLAFVLWLTIAGANYPSLLLSAGLFQIQEELTKLFRFLGAPDWLHGVLVLGMYRVLAWVVSVMLPPMAIFFPLFTLLEDAGYLPRIAYNLDKPFQKCHACGKQGLSMCMGFGCNAAGVVGCRIIDSPREQMIAILTNNFVPCNGRFPTLIALITMFFIGTQGTIGASFVSAGLLTLLVLLGVGMTFCMSWLLSKTILKGMPSAFTLELPPYRRPQIGKVIVRSIFDRTLFVLRRAIAVAAPAGILIWILANVTVGDVSLLGHCTAFLDPFAHLLGMDGVILTAFILGFPANEIVMPIMIMAYMAQGSLMEMENLAAMKVLFVSQGWTWVTAVCVMIFSLMHWPCSTTLLSIKKETGSWKWTLLAAVLPTGTGMLLCFLISGLAKLVGFV
ncbi:MAG: ferrous iron transporter B [Lachnospiraceae bacterium]|nr:ferrous iron transporter B [Lachnospiraceae bacterium]MDD7378223.1 ferrous iron transporter B [Lachnospiraceae bacterium]MDY4616878.1 ferrous iron transporter B [Lachnospiraceae bacterium]